MDGKLLIVIIMLGLIPMSISIFLFIFREDYIRSIKMFIKWIFTGCWRGSKCNYGYVYTQRECAFGEVGLALVLTLGATTLTILFILIS